jgi:hypothetical protein
VLPPYDLKTPRWKATTVGGLDEEALLAAGELRGLLAIEYGDWCRGRDHGVIPGPGPRRVLVQRGRRGPGEPRRHAARWLDWRTRDLGRVAAEQLLGPDQAAEHMEICRTGFGCR